MCKDDDKNKDSEAYKDAFRKPRELLQFAGLQPNAKVLDVCTGFGYLAKHAALMTGHNVVVDAHNGLEWKPFFQSVGIDQDALPAMRRAGVHHYYAPLQNPILPGHDHDYYDLVMMQNTYHDLYDMPVNRLQFLVALRRAVKRQGGKLLLVDHCAAPGCGSRDAGANRGLHRIEEVTVRAELAASGWRIVATSDLLRCATDNYRQSAWTHPMRETDRFVLLCEPM